MKKGISLVSLIIVIVVMVILAGIVVVTGLDSNENITIDTFALELLDVQNGVDEYYYRYEKYPSGNEYILDVTKVESLDQFAEEDVVENGINFKIVDLSLIGIKSTEFGSGEGKDIYVLSEKTGIVYYLEGVTYENKIYYTLTDELYEITNANNSELVSTQDIKVYNVIFSPSTTEYTNKPVTVKIKIPKIAVINSITTTNNKSVGTEIVEGLYKQVQINETSTDKTGNYKITVNYTYRGTEKTSEYEVTNYDANLPEITYKETINGDLKTVNITIDSNNSKIKTVKYEQEIVSQITYFKNYGRQVTNNKFIIEKDSYFTIYVETESGTKLMVNNMPEDWKANVIDIVDGVPIPKGFVASPYKDENKKDSGLVIYELAENETEIPRTETQFESWTERNQYVWVPVDDFTKFIRKDYINETSKVVDTDGKYNALGISGTYWEVMVDENNLPLATLEEQGNSYMSAATLTEVQAMYASVKKYGGFYIARYEAGIDSQRASDTATLITGENVHSKMGKIPYNHIKWSTSAEMNVDTGAAVDVARGLYPNDITNKTGVISTLVYGVQWDTTIKWYIDTGAMTLAEARNSTSFGNYSNHVINSTDELNEKSLVWDYSTNSNGSYVTKGSETLTYPKVSGTYWVLSTGALKAANINNIYDMAGNMTEWTMEGLSANGRVLRGGHLRGDGDSASISCRYHGGPDYAYSNRGFRFTLYIKK